MSKQRAGGPAERAVPREASGPGPAGLIPSSANGLLVLGWLNGKESTYSAEDTDVGLTPWVGKIL